jgi:hypothetical protein
LVIGELANPFDEDFFRLLPDRFVNHADFAELREGCKSIGWRFSLEVRVDFIVELLHFHIWLLELLTKSVDVLYSEEFDHIYYIIFVEYFILTRRGSL